MKKEKQDKTEKNKVDNSQLLRKNKKKKCDKCTIGHAICDGTRANCLKRVNNNSSSSQTTQLTISNFLVNR